MNNKDMDFDYYRIFYYVGKYKSVTLAAQELFTSQPAVTRTIKNLEHDLGCRLFIRSKKGMELTREGEVLFEYASASFNQLEKGEAEVRKNTSSKEGRITIGATVTALDEFLFRFIKAFHENNPNIKFKIVSESTNKTIDKLRNGVIDVALVTSPCETYQDVDYFTIGEFENIVCAGQGYKYLNEKENSITILQDHPFIAMSDKTQLREYTDHIFLSNGIPVNPSIEVDSAGLLIPFIRNNLGLSIVPHSLAKHALEKEEVIRLNIKEQLPKRHVYMITSKVLPLSNATKIFIKEVKKMK